MPELKYAKTRRLRRFESADVDKKRIQFRHVTSSYSKRSFAGLLVMASMVAYLLYYLSKV